MITWGQLGLQDAASPVIEEFLFFHDFAIVLLIFIITGVRVILIGLTINPVIHLGLIEAQTLECIWTLIPALILIQVAAPSLILLYILDERRSDRLTIKVIGHQWYWSYEFRDFWHLNGPVRFDSFILPEEERLDSSFRLLDVDRRVPAPFGANIRILVRRADVLHAWTIPSLGVKADACPGRLNQIKFVRHRPGIFFGQCREICGANHSFIPIIIEFFSVQDFIKWVNWEIKNR